MTRRWVIISRSKISVRPFQKQRSTSSQPISPPLNLKLSRTATAITSRSPINLFQIHHPPFNFPNDRSQWEFYGIVEGGVQFVLPNLSEELKATFTSLNYLDQGTRGWYEITKELQGNWKEIVKQRPRAMFLSINPLNTGVVFLEDGFEF